MKTSEKHQKKKVITIVSLVLIEMICLGCIYLIGSYPGAYAWNLCVFILAPIACVSLIPQIVFLIRSICKKKSLKFQVALIALTLIFAYPISILFGQSFLTYPRLAKESSKVTMKVPVENAVLMGGRDFKTHAVWPSECYAYDVLVNPYDCGSLNLNDYGIYLAPVIAPVSGTVLEVKDSEEDIPPNTEEYKSASGNYIYLRIEETGTYLILAHLEKDSITVKAGDHVEAGEIIAKVGNSGTTTEPHLHIQHQKNNPCTMKIPVCSVGLPISFEEQ